MNVVIFSALKTTIYKPPPSIQSSVGFSGYSYIATARDEHIMLLKFPIIRSSNSFFLHLLFLKLFPEMRQLNMYFLFQIAVVEVQNKYIIQYSNRAVT